MPVNPVGLHRVSRSHSDELGVNLSRMHIASPMSPAELREEYRFNLAKSINATSFAARARAARGQAKPCRVPLPTPRS